MPFRFGYLGPVELFDERFSIRKGPWGWSVNVLKGSMEFGCRVYIHMRMYMHICRYVCVHVHVYSGLQAVTTAQV